MTRTHACPWVVLLVALLASGIVRAGDDEAPPAAPPKPVPVAMHVSGTWVKASIDLVAFQHDPDGLKMLREAVGDKALLAGDMTHADITVSVIAETESKIHLTSAQWRERITATAGRQFDIDAIACTDTSEALDPEIRHSDFHAFPVAAGVCFDIHMSSMDPPDDPALSKDRFVEFVRTFRVGIFRRGSFAEYPPEVLDAMNAVAFRIPADWLAWSSAQQAARPADWTVPFVTAEAMRFRKAPDASCVEPYARALELLAKLKPTEPKTLYAWAVAEEGMGLSLHCAGKYAAAVPHLKKGLEIATGLGSPLRGGLAYNLACASCRNGDASGAIAALRIAIETDDGYREKCAKDADFASMKDRADFKALVAAPPAPVKGR